MNVADQTIEHMNANTLTQAYGGLNQLVTKLQVGVDMAHDSGVARLPGLLMDQTQTLNNLFRLLGISALESKDIAAQAELLRLGLRAQAQCVLTAKVVTDLNQPQRVSSTDLRSLTDAELLSICSAAGSSD